MKVRVKLMIRIENESNVINARYGRYQGNKYLFTHRDPKSGYLFAEDMDPKKDPWVPSESVVLEWDD